MRFEQQVIPVTSANTTGEAALDNGSCPNYTPDMETEYMFHIRKREAARV
jgi:hypothetical protein